MSDNLLYDLFGTDSPEPKSTMNQIDFFDKTKTLLEKIEHIYSRAWQNRVLKEDEAPSENICENCTGCGLFTHDNEEKECFIDYEAGDCFHRFCDYEQVGMDLEECLGEIYELLSVDEIAERTESPNA